MPRDSVERLALLAAAPTDDEQVWARSADPVRAAVPLEVPAAGPAHLAQFACDRRVIRGEHHPVR
jgi:hypothetical protein